MKTTMIQPTEKKRVWYVQSKCVVTYQAQVHATTEEEALEKARNIDDADWYAQGRGNFTITGTKTFLEAHK